jgi:hypothetical protein
MIIVIGHIQRKPLVVIRNAFRVRYALPIRLLVLAPRDQAPQ